MNRRFAFEDKSRHIIVDRAGVDTVQLGLL